MLKRAICGGLILGGALQAATVGQLLDGVKSHYRERIDQLSLEESDKALGMVQSQFWPKIRIFGSITHYNSPTNLRPVTPTENAVTAPDYPFSRDIERIGATVSMPIFVANLFTLVEKARTMRRSVRAKKRLNLLKDQATVLGANADLRYLEEMEAALRSKARTLRSTERIVRAKVRSGRASGSALYKVQARLDSIRIALDNIAIQKENLRVLVESLSGVDLRRSAPMRKKGRIKVREFLALQPLKAKARADRLEAEAQREMLYPSLHLQGDINRGYGESYESGRRIHRDYGGIGLTLSAPLLDMPQIRSLQKARINAMKSAVEVEKTAAELRAKAKGMRRQVQVLEHSLGLHRRNIANEKRLLAIARKSYEEGRMTLEEYLRYVDALYDAKAQLYKTQALWWQTLAQLAFLYGNDFKRIVR
ncbi:TolC family protein [Nitratifractor sp.]